METNNQEIDEIIEKIDLHMQHVFENSDFLIESFKELISKIELLLDSDIYDYYKYIYHFEYSKYNLQIGKTELANRQSALSKGFIDSYNKTLTIKINDSLNTEKMDQECVDIFTKIESYGLIQKDMLEILKNVKRELDQILHKKVNNFTEYKILVKISDSLKTHIDEACLELNKEASNGSIIALLYELSQKIEVVIYKIRIGFMQRVFVSTEPKKLLFDELTDKTKESIINCYKKLSPYFHPDKWYDDENQALANNVFQIINQLKENLLKSIDRKKSVDEMIDCQKKGDEMWLLAHDVNYAINGEWDQMQRLPKVKIENSNETELKELRKKWFKESYKNYRDACKIADEIESTKKQIELRIKMALLLNESGEYIEAQLFAIGAIKSILISGSIEQLHKALKTLEIVKGQHVINDRDKKILNELEANSLKNNKTRNIQETLNKFTEEILSKQIIKCDKALVSYTTPEEFILKTKQKAALYKTRGTTALVTGIGAGVVGIGGGLLVATTTGIEILQGIGILAGAAVAGPVVLVGALIGGICLISGGLIAGGWLIYKGKKLLKEPEIRENLNKIISEAVILHEKKEYLKFLNKLSEPYCDKECLLTFKSRRDNIDTNKIAKCLLKHGFRPDGIGYLFNLIAEALASRSMNIDGWSPDELVNKAIDVYNGTIYEKELDSEAKLLDERITELRKTSLKSRVKSWYNQMKDISTLKDYTFIAKEFVKDAQIMPFKSRLDETRNIAKLNIAIINILNGNDYNIENAKKLIEEVRDSVYSNFQFASKLNLRIEVLEDFFWITTGHSLGQDKALCEQTTPISPEEPTQSLNLSKIYFLRDELIKSNSVSEKLVIHKNIARIFESEAKKISSSNKLRSLIFWQQAKNTYKEAFKLNSTDKESGIGYARSLINLCEFSSLEIFLNENRNYLSSSEEYWLYYTIAYRKCINYDKAQHFINETLMKYPRSAEAVKERELILKLNEKNELKELNQIDIREDYFQSNQRLYENKRYKILSIDGGGVRGIIPALWLHEIERRTLKPISHLFNMVAGTSVGGIIAAGVTLPKLDDSNRMSGFEPRYQAFKIFELFKTESKRIFSNSSNIFPFFNWKSLAAEKYTDTNKSQVFTKFFGQAEIKDCLTDIMIPAYNENIGNQSYLFRKNDESNRTTKISDVLMATSAAPTFFPAYKINGIEGKFLDGGVNINNPAMRTYTESEGKNSKNTFVLSLGTGSYIPDPLNPSKYRGKLFWAKEISGVVLNPQEGNTDIEMNDLLGDRYQRWQVFIEKPIALDAFDEASLEYLIEIGKQYMEEEEDQLKKLIEILQE